MTHYLRATLVAAGVAAQGAIAPQTPPPTDVYLADLRPPGPVERLLNISNNADYDNQPSFTPDGRAILFSSRRDGKQTDIYRYEIASGSLTQLTHTAESEYSPLVTPDGQTFSVVRVESDNAQRLWRFELDGTNPRLVLQNVKPVGYHVWIDATRLGLFVLGVNGGPNTLQLADTATGRADVIDTNIGRGLQIRPGKKTLTFVSKASTPWTIKEFDPATRAVTVLTSTLEGSEDFAWDRGEGFEVLFMAKGSKLFAWTAGAPEWREQADFSSVGVTRITRLAVRPTPGRPRFAVVGEK